MVCAKSKLFLEHGLKYADSWDIHDSGFCFKGTKLCQDHGFLKLTLKSMISDWKLTNTLIYNL